MSVKLFSRNKISFLKMCAVEHRDRALTVSLRAEIMKYLQQAQEEKTNVERRVRCRANDQLRVL
jgi:hypothetical protein